MDPKQLLQFSMLSGASGVNPPPSSEAALADLAFNQAVLAQMMAGGGMPPPPLPPPTSGSPSPAADLNLAAIAAAAAASGAANLNEETFEALQEKQQEADQNPKYLFSCLVCNNFGCDTVDELSAHLSLDRSRTGENEVGQLSFYSFS